MAARVKPARASRMRWGCRAPSALSPDRQPDLVTASTIPQRCDTTPPGLSAAGPDDLPGQPCFLTACIDAPASRRVRVARERPGKERLEAHAAGRVVSRDGVECRMDVPSFNVKSIQLEVAVRIAP